MKTIGIAVAAVYSLAVGLFLLGLTITAWQTSVTAGLEITLLFDPFATAVAYVVGLIVTAIINAVHQRTVA